MSGHDSSLYVPTGDLGQLKARNSDEIHSAQLTVAEYSVRERLHLGDLVDLLDMLGIHPAGPYTEQETTK